MLVAILAIANRSPGLSPDYLAEFVLYALIAADLTMVVALVFVLARNIVKLVVERRGGRPFARFRAKLVALLIGMTLVPAVLVLAVGSELIRTSVGRWFNVPMDEILSSANEIAADYYQERQVLVGRSRGADCAAAVAADLTRPTTSTRARVDLARGEHLAGAGGPGIPRRPGRRPRRPRAGLGRRGARSAARYSRAAADRLAAQVLAASDETRAVETFGSSAICCMRPR